MIFGMIQGFPIEVEEIEPVDGSMYRVRLSISPSEGDDLAYPEFSVWRLEEDGKPIGPCHALHADVAHLGEGRNSHWQGHLFFSATDNSDPRSNGRSYRLFRARRRLLPSCAVRALYVLWRYNAILGRHCAGLTLYVLLKPLCWLVFLPDILLGTPKFDRRDFASFFKTIFDLTEPPWPSMLTEYFRQYVDRSFFRDVSIVDPALEIAVAEGASSIAYLNYPFAMGTEYAFDFCQQFAHRLPHKEFKYFDLKDSDGLPADVYETIVMIHSIDDFDSPETILAFRSMAAVLRKGGRVYFSGFTEKYRDAWFPYRFYRLIGGSKSFSEYRLLHPENFLNRSKINELCSDSGFVLRRYDEYTFDPRFKFFYVAEKYSFKRFPLGVVKRQLWRIPGFKTLHSWIDSILARGIMRGELKWRQRGNRGLNFFCCIEKA